MVVVLMNLKQKTDVVRSVLIAISFISLWLVWNTRNNWQDFADNRTVISELFLSTNELTRLASHYVYDPKNTDYRARFDNIIKSRGPGAINLINQFKGISSIELGYANKSMRLSDELATQEREAFAAVEAGRMAVGMSIMFGSEYDRTKSEILLTLLELEDEIVDEGSGDIETSFNTSIIVIGATLGAWVVFMWKAGRDYQESLDTTSLLDYASSIGTLDSPAGKAKIFKETYNAFPDGVLIADKAGEIWYVNDRFCHIMGYKTAEEIMGKTIHDMFFPPERKEDHIKKFTGFPEHGAVAFRRVSPLGADGRIREIELGVSSTVVKGKVFRIASVRSPEGSV